METKYIGAYRIDTHNNNFFQTHERFNKYWKDGYALAAFTEDGLYWKRESLVIPTTDYRVVITRSQGYRYWRKHFSNRYCWRLPEALEMAVSLYDDSEVVIVTEQGIFTTCRDNI